MKKELIIVTVLMLLHSLEEITFYVLFPHPFGLPSLSIFIPVQVALFGLLTFALWKPKSKILSVPVGIILLYEIVHLSSAWSAGAYTPGLLTAILLIGFAAPYWFKLYSNLSLKKI